MFIVREVNKSISKTLTGCHFLSAVIAILVFNNLNPELWVWPCLMSHASLKAINLTKVKERTSMSSQMTSCNQMGCLSQGDGGTRIFSLLKEGLLRTVRMRFYCYYLLLPTQVYQEIVQGVFGWCISVGKGKKLFIHS